MTNEKEEGVTMENNFDNTPENNGQQPEQPVYTDPNADVNQQSSGGEGKMCIRDRVWNVWNAAAAVSYVLQNAS